MKKPILLLWMIPLGVVIYFVAFLANAPESVTESQSTRPLSQPVSHVGKPEIVQAEIEKQVSHQPHEKQNNSLAGDIVPSSIMVDGVSYKVNTGATAGFVDDHACQSCHPSI